MKKTISILFLLILVLSILSGCGDTANNNLEQGYYKSGDQTIHIDKVVIDKDRTGRIGNDTDSKVYIFYSIDSESSNKSVPYGVDILVNGANEYLDSFQYNKTTDRMKELLKGTKYEGFLDAEYRYDPSTTLCGVVQCWITEYDTNHLESFKIRGLGVDIDYPVDEIMIVNGFSAADITW